MMLATSTSTSTHVRVPSQGRAVSWSLSDLSLAIGRSTYLLSTIRIVRGSPSPGDMETLGAGVTRTRGRAGHHHHFFCSTSPSYYPFTAFDKDFAACHSCQRPAHTISFRKGRVATVPSSVTFSIPCILSRQVQGRVIRASKIALLSNFHLRY